MFAIVQASPDGIVFSSSGGMQGSIGGAGRIETGSVRLEAVTTGEGESILTVRPR